MTSHSTTYLEAAELEDGFDGAGPQRGRPVPTKVLWLLLAGLVLLIASAAALPKLSGWSEHYGSIPVFLGFFLLMSLAGRWFWQGMDAVIGAVRGR
ncbi:MAG: hypothetical protein QM662_13425 [Gordonia sp. (in: high G+C Gram-positive bacteria)]